MTRALQPARQLGRYVLLEAFASGGMAAVHFGQQLGPAGIKRVVAIKRLHPHLVYEEAFTRMFFDEARMAMRIRHPNVVPVLDVIAEEGELFIVMEYVAGLALARIGPRTTNEPMPSRIASAVVGDTLLGLHAAHEATNEAGEPLGLVHRDVSPHNVLVGGDGIARVIDFGIAKASGRAYATPAPGIKGKIGYMAPEQLSGGAVSPRSDIYSASVMLWECLAGRKLVAGDERVAIDQITRGEFDPPSVACPELGAEIDAAVMRGLARDPADRWESAREMAAALDAVLPRASVLQVSAWMEETAGNALADLAGRARAAESSAPPAPGDMALAPPILAPGFVDVLVAQHDTVSIPPPGRLPTSALGGSPMRRWIPWLGAAAGVALAGLALAAWLARPAIRVEAVGGDTSGPPLEDTPPPVTLSDPVAASTARVLPTLPPGLVAEKALPAPSAPLPAAAFKSRAPAPDSSRRRDDDCQVPFVIDDQGRRRYNRACLHP